MNAAERAKREVELVGREEILRRRRVFMARLRRAFNERKRAANLTERDPPEVKQ